MKRKTKEKVLLAMSGGVDSAMSAVILDRLGFDVTGVHFVMFENGKGEGEVIKIAKKIGIPLKIIDIKKQFKEKVIDKFVEEYKLGRTPNPCVFCNPKVKFENLLEEADKLGIEKIATGHYAIVKDKADYFSLKKASDLSKDQSYFLYRLEQDQLERIIFPLAGLKKADVKKEARKMGLVIATEESQDVCFFLKDESLNSFLKKHIALKKGDILNEKGEILGKHSGTHLFTRGQRRGLGLSGGPYYVIKKNKKNNQVIVSGDISCSNLWSKKIFIKKISWINNPPSEKIIYTGKTRYLSKEEECRIKFEGKGSWIVEFKNPCWAVTPGQSLVLYNKDEVIGGGLIENQRN